MISVFGAMRESSVQNDVILMIDLMEPEAQARTLLPFPNARG